MSVRSQIKNCGLDILLGVDGLWVSRGFLIGLNIRIASLREVDTAGTSAHIIFGESGGEWKVELEQRLQKDAEIVLLALGDVKYEVLTYLNKHIDLVISLRFG